MKILFLLFMKYINIIIYIKMGILILFNIFIIILPLNKKYCEIFSFIGSILILILLLLFFIKTIT